MRDVFIVDAVRTPIGRGKNEGALHGVHPVDLLAQTLNALVERAGIDKAQFLARNQLQNGMRVLENF